MGREEVSESCLIWKPGLWRCRACSCEARQNGSVQEGMKKIKIIIKKDMKASSYNMLSLCLPPSVPPFDSKLKAGLECSECQMEAETMQGRPQIQD